MTPKPTEVAGNGNGTWLVRVLLVSLLSIVGSLAGMGTRYVFNKLDGLDRRVTAIETEVNHLKGTGHVGKN